MRGPPSRGLGRPHGGVPGPRLQRLQGSCFRPCGAQLCTTDGVGSLVSCWPGSLRPPGGEPGARQAGPGGLRRPRLRCWPSPAPPGRRRGPARPRAPSKGFGSGLGDVSLGVEGRERWGQPGQGELGSCLAVAVHGIRSRGRRSSLEGHTHLPDEPELLQEGVVRHSPSQAPGRLRGRERGQGGCWLLGCRDTVHQQRKELLLAGQFRRQAGHVLALWVRVLASRSVGSEEPVKKGGVVRAELQARRLGRGRGGLRGRGRGKVSQQQAPCC